MPIAAAAAEAGKRMGQPEVIFFTVKSEAHLPKQVRNACGLKNVVESPQVCGGGGRGGGDGSCCVGVDGGGGVGDEGGVVDGGVGRDCVAVADGEGAEVVDGFAAVFMGGGGYSGVGVWCWC